jgi:hypothetical protein
MSALAADDADAAARTAIESGDAGRAVDQWGRAAAILDGVAGKDHDRASHLLNRGLALAAMGRHEEAVQDIELSLRVLEPLPRQGRTYDMAMAVLYREKKLLELHASHRAATSDVTSGLRPQTLILARAVREDTQFRRSFLLDNAAPVAFPDQVATLLDMTPRELATLSSYAMRVHRRYQDDLMKRAGGMLLGFNTQLSARMMELLREPVDSNMIDTLEAQVESEPRVDRDSDGADLRTLRRVD